ncbi:MAG: threonylcarbamoyl-AMP synthase [Nitrospinae bacterium]|nr:threonylcarbamoyl-AMP synthase [Nitrospinota bacterium]
MAEILKINFNRPDGFQEQIGTVKETLNRGGVIAFPTDTFYGLGANPFNERAVAHIFKIKNRPAHKPILVLVASVKQVDQLASEIGSETEKLIHDLWPGPLTLLFKALPHLPKPLTGGTGKVGIRLPDHDFSRKLIEYLDLPLTAPSANVSGGKNLSSAEEVAQALGGDIDLVLDGGRTSGGKESTVLDAAVHPPKLIREGAVSKKQIESALHIHLSHAP